jgi:lipopolysaccharide export system permease protein
MLRTQRSYSGKRFSINVQRVDGRTLIRPTFTFYGQQDAAPVMITAEEAQLSVDLAQNALRIRLTNWEVDGGEVAVVWPDTEEFHIPLDDAAHKAEESGRPSDIALREIPVTVRRQLLEITRVEQSQAAEAAQQMLTGDFSALTSTRWQQHREARLAARARLHRLYTEPWRRWANGFSCFAFVLLGVPLAIRLRNSDVWTSFAICFLPILAFYYPLLAFGVGQAKAGQLPPYCVWLGNIVLMLIGTAALKRVLRF